MTPRRLDSAVIQERLREIQLLLADLVEIGDVDAERLRRERSTRHIVERVLSQIVELAGSINTHIVASLLGRSPSSYADSFDDVARAGVIEWDLAAALRPSVGMRNVLVTITSRSTTARYPQPSRLHWSSTASMSSTSRAGSATTFQRSRDLQWMTEDRPSPARFATTWSNWMRSP
jgi:uncharacterized protein YutE (UPF0331/DUF86 family)